MILAPQKDIAFIVEPCRYLKFNSRNSPDPAWNNASVPRGTLPPPPPTNTPPPYPPIPTPRTPLRIGVGATSM